MFLSRLQSYYIRAKVGTDFVEILKKEEQFSAGVRYIFLSFFSVDFHKYLGTLPRKKKK